MPFLGESHRPDAPIPLAGGRVRPYNDRVTFPTFAPGDEHGDAGTARVALRERGDARG